MTIIFPDPSSQTPVNEFSPASYPEANLQDNFIYLYNSSKTTWESSRRKMYFSTINPVGSPIIAYEGGLCSRDDFTNRNTYEEMNPLPGEWIQPENTSPIPPPPKPAPNTALYWEGEKFIWLSFPVSLDLKGAKDYLISQIRTKAYEILLPTDWYLSRKVETGEDAPADVLNWRAEVRVAAQEKIGVVSSKASIKSLQNYCQDPDFLDWPEKPE